MKGSAGEGGGVGYTKSGVVGGSISARGGAGSPAKRVGARNAGALVRMAERVEEDSEVASASAYELAEALGVQAARHAGEREGAGER